MSDALDLKEQMYRVNDDLWSAGNLDIIDDYVAEDYIEYNNASPDPIRGRDGYRENIQLIRNAFPDLEVTTEHILVEGDLAANHYTITGTHTGEFMDIPPTEETVTISGISIGRFEDGYVVEGWTNADVFGLLTQLGVVDTPG